MNSFYYPHLNNGDWPILQGGAIPKLWGNFRTKQFKRRGVIQEGKVLIPTKLVITYRFKEHEYSGDPFPRLRAWAIVHNDAEAGIRSKPVKININIIDNESNDILLDSGDTDDKFLETSQVIYLNNEYFITNFVAEVFGAEHLARIREVVLFARPDEFGDEQEYRLQ